MYKILIIAGEPSGDSLGSKLIKEMQNQFQEIIDLQKKIYSDEKDIEYREKYEHKLNNKADKQLKVIEKAIENISGNLSGEIKLNLI